jgi:hypothetical protein
MLVRETVEIVANPKVEEVRRKSPGGCAIPRVACGESWRPIFTSWWENNAVEHRRGAMGERVRVRVVEKGGIVYAR